MYMYISDGTSYTISCSLHVISVTQTLFAINIYTKTVAANFAAEQLSLQFHDCLDVAHSLKNTPCYIAYHATDVYRVYFWKLP